MSRAADIMRGYVDALSRQAGGVPLLHHVTLTQDGSAFQRLYEGKVVDVRFKGNLRIDQPTHLHGAGKVHAHVYGRRGDELVVVNFDGTASHGTKARLHRHDADALRARGFEIGVGDIVECVVVQAIGPEILLG